MGKIVSICNQKGGTGKTTTAVNLAHALACLEKKVLIVDADPQGNSTSGVGVNKNTIQKSAYDVLLNRTPTQEAITQNVYPYLDIIPCNINLTGAEIELVGAISRETRLKKAMQGIKALYDFILIDSPPSLGLLTLNSLVASDSIIIPIQCEFYALEGVSQLLNTLDLIRDGLNPGLQLEGVLLTMADFRTNLTSEVIKEITNYFQEKVYKTIIPRNIKLSEAPSFGKPICVYDGNSIGAKKYMEFALEFLGEAPKSFNDNNLGESSPEENSKSEQKDQNYIKESVS